MNKELLSKPFTRDQIKSRRGRKNMVYYYIRTEDVIKRLFEATKRYEIKILEKEVYDKEVIILVNLNLDGQEFQAYGSSTINGSIGDAVKSAVSDAIKKAAWHAGVPCIFHTPGSQDNVEQNNNNEEGEQYRCAVCNQAITEQVYNYSINNFNKALCIRHQREYRQASNQ